MNYKQVSKIKEAWGTDVTVAFIDKKTGQKRSKTFRFDDEKQLKAELNGRITKAIEGFKSEPKKEKIITREEVEKILKQKGYLKANEKWEDLKDKNGDNK